MPWGYGYGTPLNMNTGAPAGSYGDTYTDPNSQQKALAEMSAWWKRQRQAQAVPVAPSPPPATAAPQPPPQTTNRSNQTRATTRVRRQQPTRQTGGTSGPSTTQRLATASSLPAAPPPAVHTPTLGTSAQGLGIPATSPASTYANGRAATMGLRSGGMAMPGGLPITPEVLALVAALLPHISPGGTWGSGSATGTAGPSSVGGFPPGSTPLTTATLGGDSRYPASTMQMPERPPGWPYEAAPVVGTERPPGWPYELPPGPGPGGKDLHPGRRNPLGSPW